MTRLAEIYRSFAALFAYPDHRLSQRARECAGLLAGELPDAARDLEEFAAGVEDAPSGRVEELYTGTFDLNPSCAPYVGHHLLGESYKRAEFLVALKDRYRERGFDPGDELADHLAVVLSFLGRLDTQSVLAAELASEALLPATRKMLGSLAGSADNPYRRVFAAVLRVLEVHAAAAACPEEASS